jgi:hypothetical protein
MATVGLPMCSIGASARTLQEPDLASITSRFKSDRTETACSPPIIEIRAFWEESRPDKEELVACYSRLVFTGVEKRNT